MSANVDEILKGTILNKDDKVTVIDYSKQFELPKTDINVDYQKYLYHETPFISSTQDFKYEKITLPKMDSKPIEP